MRIDDTTSLEELVQIAKSTTKKEIEKGEEFIVKDLFRGFEWNRISVGKRTTLGSMYLSFAENEGSQLILKIEKTPQNQQRYRKL